MRFFFYAPLSFEQWDWRSPDDQGIGGSETAVVEMARRLANRGHEVTVYAKLRDDCPRLQFGGAEWLPLDAADFTAPGIWVLSRCPSALDNFPVEHPGQQTWLVCQDVFYPNIGKDGLTSDRIARLDRCLPLCTAQEKWLILKSADLAGKTYLSSNGVRTDLIEQIESTERIARDPYKLIYSSSPDRGLPALLKIFRRVREFEPRLRLTVAYGWNNIISGCKGKYWDNIRRDCDELMKQPGVTWRGRLPQPELYREFMSSGIWCYPTTFSETSCCSCMEAQAMGAIPVTNPFWALLDNVRHGIFLPGDVANEPLVQASYVGEIIRLTRQPELQEQIRSAMIPWARERFNWERVVDEYEAMASDPLVSHAGDDAPGEPLVTCEEAALCF